MRRIHLTNAVDVSGEKLELLIQDGIISTMGASISTHQMEGNEEIEVVDLHGRVIAPSLVDLHTHLREPGKEDAETVESGSRAAVRGGFGAISAMPNTNPIADTAGVV